MKRIALYLAMALLLPLTAAAQSAMTDQEVAKFVLKEQKAGTSQAQIVTKLMQRGVSIDQIRRIKRKYEQQKKKGDLGGGVDYQTADNDEDRQRTAKERQQERAGDYTTSRVRDLGGQHTYDEDDDEFMQMQDELDLFAPDSTEMRRQEWERAYERAHRQQVFGRNIFNRKNLSFEPAMNIATPASYVIGPGDVVIIDVYGATQKSVKATVTPDGDVVVEGFGPIPVGGMTVEKAQGRIRQLLGTRYQSSQIKMSIGQTRSITVNVMGEVKTPGTYQLSAFATVFNALYMAGGTNDIGTLRAIKVFRHNRLVATADVYDYILNGSTGNIRLADNDVIYVGAYDCLVNVAGKVKRPMFYEMKSDESLGTLLKYAGGFTGDAYTKAVRVMRKTGRERAVFNIGEFDMGSFHVADGDSVSVDSILPRYANTVEVRGAVFRPGMYQLGGEITTVRSLLQHAEGMTEEAFTARAVMHRMKADRQLEVLAIDAAGIMAGTAADVPLRENDILFIPTKTEAQTDRTLTIHGEVHYPGVYRFADNETLEDFVLQAGGLKESASTVKVDVSRRVIDTHATAPDSIIARTYSFALKDGFVVDGTPGFRLMPFDEVYVRRSPGYYEQQNIEVQGEVMFAGTYTLSKKEQRLSDAIRAAGGPNDRAYLKGARLERRYNAEERKQAEEALKKAREELEQSLQDQAVKTGNAGMMQMQAQQQLAKYEIGETYPVGIELEKAMAQPGSNYDLVLREGDRLIVPQLDNTVKISGEVLYPNTVGFVRGKSLSYYIDQAGGYGTKAKKGRTYVIYMNGTVERLSHGAKAQPGCRIIVPSKNLSRTSVQETLSIATSVGSFAAIIATIASLIK